MTNEEMTPVGERIKQARRERDLDLEELAGRIGCSGEYLQWVEDGQVEPPVALLLQIGKSMNLDTGAFLSMDDSPERRLDESAKRTKAYSYRTLTPPEADKHLMAFSITIPPQTGHEGVGYQHEGEEFVYVVSGEVELLVDKEKYRLGEKESHRFNANVNHHLSNPGDETAELLVILYVP
ncbi:MAG: cupin domain-containing protein [Deltaproteobacteria bacterium]|nr:cupin domain-containing protein [Deltaproteobacteria bacterium]